MEEQLDTFDSSISEEGLEDYKPQKEEDLREMMNTPLILSRKYSVKDQKAKKVMPIYLRS
jgi:hypothetical protein